MKKKILKSLSLFIICFFLLTLADLAFGYSLTLTRCLNNVYFSSLIFFSTLMYIIVRFIRKRDWKLLDWLSFFFILYPLAAIFYLLIVFLIGYVAFGQEDALNVVKIVTNPFTISFTMTVVLYFSQKNQRKEIMEGSGDAR